MIAIGSHQRPKNNFLAIAKTWTPASITTAAWYDASDESTITESGGSVSQLDDKSGNGNHVSQGTGANQPTTGTRTVNGLNVLDFTTNKMLYTTASVLSGDPNLIMATVILYDSNIGTQDRCMQVGKDNGETVGIGGGSDGYSVRYNNGNEIYGSTTTGSALIQVLTRPSGGDYASAQMFINGTENTATSSSAPTSTLSGMGTSFTVGGGTYGASSVGDIDESIDGIMAEVVVALDNTVATRQLIEGYLAHKWGLESSLPSGHPYRYSPPKV